MAGLRFDLVTPEKLAYSGVVVGVGLPGSEGDFEVAAGHAPVMATIRPGVISIREGAGAPKQIYVRCGFAEAAGESLTVLAEQAIALEDIKPGLFDAEIAAAEAALAAATSDPEQMEGQMRLAQIRDLSKVLAK